jgi:UDP-N-acetylmuramoyl-L-alanyl-D-glutamate--2,6-diaminopimelate ligase
MYLKDALKDIRFRASTNAAHIDVRGVTDDSRAVKKGYLFIAKKGYVVDGSRFIADAIKNGARAIAAEEDFDAPSGVVKILVRDTRSALSAIADNFYGHPSDKLKVIGITGTNGKTTITYLLESIVKAAGNEAGVIGTINYRLKNKVLPAKNTTPGPLELQALLADMVKMGIDYAIMEVSSHSLDQGRVDRLFFDTAIFTNLTGDHLDYHKTMAGYFKAKKRIFEKLKKGGAAILNGDDKKAASLKRSLKNAVLYGTKKNTDVSAEDIKLSMNGTSFTVKTKECSFAIETRLIGMHNVSNILAATAAAMSLKIPESAIVKGVGRLAAIPGRLEAVEAGQPFKVFVDFAHTEDALFNVLSLLREIAEKRIVTVFGCGGNRDRTKRPRMGKVACKFSDHVIITSDNPRSEEPCDIVSEIESGVRGAFSNYDIVLDRQEAIAKAFEAAEKGDIVVIAGKGHEAYQIVKDRTLAFDDRIVAKNLLGAKYER